MITLNKHVISANVKDRYANIVYAFHFESMKKWGSDELKFEITIDPNAFISKFEADIDGQLFVGTTKEKQTASKEYIAAKIKNENTILISQPHKNIPNVFEIKTNISSKSKILLTIQIEQYLQKKFEFNQLDIQILRNFSKYNIEPKIDNISFKLNVEDESGIYDVNIPMIEGNNSIVIDEQIMNKTNTKCEINGIIITKSQHDAVNMSTNRKWRQQLKVGHIIVVKDGDYWYNAEILKVDSDQNEIKIHYVEFDSKYDEVINVFSNRLTQIESDSANIQINELTLKYKIKGEQNDSNILFDNKSNTFCHIISDVLSESKLDVTDMNEGQNDDDGDIKDNVFIPRRVMFVIDRSASMGGPKWNKTISAMIMAIKQLRKGYDRFNIIVFDDYIELLPYKDSKICLLADDVSISDSITALKNKNVRENTNINDTLLRAIQMIKDDIILLNNDNNCKYNFFMNQIIFITDGEPNKGEENSNMIITNVKEANNLSKIDKYNNKISIFSFGVGKDGNDSGWIDDLNHSFLKILALNNNGFYQRIKQTTADTAFCEYFNILSQPVLTNINVEYKNKNIIKNKKNRCE